MAPEFEGSEGPQRFSRRWPRGTIGVGITARLAGNPMRIDYNRFREPATASNYLFTTEFTGLHALSCGDWFWALLTILKRYPYSQSRGLQNTTAIKSGLLSFGQNSRFDTSHCNAAKLFATIDWSDRNPSLRRPESNQRS
jgi:hypothetical protein